jgi:hypothetical protein
MRSVYDDGVLNFYRGDFTKPDLPEEEFMWDESVYEQELMEESEDDSFQTTTTW